MIVCQAPGEPDSAKPNIPTLAPSKAQYSHFTPDVFCPQQKNLINSHQPPMFHPWGTGQGSNSKGFGEMPLEKAPKEGDLRESSKI